MSSAAVLAPVLGVFASVAQGFFPLVMALFNYALVGISLLFVCYIIASLILAITKPVIFFQEFRSQIKYLIGLINGYSMFGKTFSALMAFSCVVLTWAWLGLPFPGRYVSSSMQGLRLDTWTGETVAPSQQGEQGWIIMPAGSGRPSPTPSP
jgi:hypothetical protein